MAKDLLGAGLEWIGLLGRRVAELHIAMASDHADAAFAPEPFTQHYQRSLYQSLRKSALMALEDLERRVKSLPPDTQRIARAVLEREDQLLAAFRAVLGQNFSGKRIRVHGNLQLDRVLHTGKDFLIVDFEGKASRSLSARRLKRSATIDLAALVHSLHRAAAHAMLRMPTLRAATPETMAAYQQAAAFWHAWCSSALLRSYVAVASATDLLPSSREQLDILLSAHLMAEAVEDLEDSLDDSERIAVPLTRILDLIGE
jgi:maltose alpha-D-glucosyltransferase/alpha-amylase